MLANQNSFSQDSNREMVVSRIINAPRELVFEAFADREHLSLWWGPNGFRTTTYSMDVRPGGVWKFMMHGPDGTDYPNTVVYTEIKKPERLVYEHGSDLNDEHRFQATITFEAQGNKTKVTLRALFITVDEFETSKKFGAVEGGNQTLERLEKYLIGVSE